MKKLNVLLCTLLAAGATSLLPRVCPAQVAPGAQSGLAAARQQVTDAQNQVRLVKADVAKIRSKIEAGFAKRADWKKASANLTKAKAAHEAAVKKVKDTVQASAEYKALKEKQLAATTRLDTLQNDRKAKEADLIKAAQDVTDAGLAVRKMEDSAMASDQNVIDTKAALAKAQEAMDGLQDEVDEALKNDEAYLAAQGELEMAEQQLASAKESMAQMARSEREAAAARRESERAAKQSTRGSGRRSGRSGGAGGYR